MVRVAETATIALSSFTGATNAFSETARAGQDGKLACRQAGNWLFVAHAPARPFDGAAAPFFRNLENS
jgi:hypothetical protein